MLVVAVMGGVDIDELAVDEDEDALAVNAGVSITKSNSDRATLGAGANVILLCFFLIDFTLNGHSNQIDPCHNDRMLPRSSYLPNFNIEHWWLYLNERREGVLSHMSLKFIRREMSRGSERMLGVLIFA